MDSINEILSKRLYVKPLGPGERFEFRVANFAQMSEEFGGPVRGASTTIAPRDIIFDPDDQKTPRKTIYNIITHSTGADGKLKIVDDYVRFGLSGNIVCDEYSNNTYMYLKRHNKNRNNPFRDRKKVVKFYEVDEARDLKIEKALFDYKAMASYQLMQTRKDSSLIEIAQRINTFKSSIAKLDVNSPSLRKTLEILTQTDPAQVMLGFNIDEMVATVIVDVAIEEVWILFNDHEQERTWNWQRNAGEKGPKKILKVPGGEDEREALITYLTTKEGSEHFAELKLRHEKNYAVTA